MAIHKGDDTDAFDFGFLTVNLQNAEQYTISKAEVVIGPVMKTFIKPVYPLRVALNYKETMMLYEAGNDCHMKIYDMKGRGITVDGSLTIPVAPKVV